MQSLRFVLCLSLIAALPLAHVQAQEPVTLGYKMTPDDRLVYRKTEELTQTTTTSGAPIGAGTSMETTEVVVWTLERVDEVGNFHIRKENKRLRMKIQAGELEFGYDSTKPKSAQEKGGEFSEMMFPIADVLSGSTTTFVMTPQGEIKEAQGPAVDLLRTMQGFANVVASKFSGAEAKEEETPQTQFMQGDLILPQEPVKPGATWTAVQESENSAVDFVNKRVFQYEGPNGVRGRPTARIDIRYEKQYEMDMEEIRPVTRVNCLLHP